MLIIDGLMALLPLFFLWRGYSKGFINEWAGLFGILCGVFFVRMYASPLGHWLIAIFNWPDKYAFIIGKVGVFILAYVLAVLLGQLITRLLKLVWLNGLNRLFGAISGCLKGAVYSAILWALYLHLMVPYFQVHHPMEGQTFIFDTINAFYPFLLDHYPAEISAF